MAFTQKAVFTMNIGNLTQCRAERILDTPGDHLDRSLGLADTSPHTPASVRTPTAKEQSGKYPIDLTKFRLEADVQEPVAKTDGFASMRLQDELDFAVGRAIHYGWIYVAWKGNFSPLHLAAQLGKLEVVQSCLHDRGAIRCLELKDDNGCRPIDYASRGISKRGKLIDLKLLECLTPEHDMIAAQVGNSDVVHALMDGAHAMLGLDLEDDTGCTTIDYASRGLSKRGDLGQTWASSETATMMKLFENAEFVERSAIAKFGVETASGSACSSDASTGDDNGGASDSLEYSSDGASSTPEKAAVAAPLPKDSVSVRVRGSGSMKLDVAVGIAIRRGWSKVTWKANFSPLHLAAKLGEPGVVRLLLRDPAAVQGLDVKDDNGCRPIDYALRGLSKRGKPIDLELLDCLSSEHHML